MKKKIMAVTLCLAMASTFVVGCGQKKETDSGKSEEKSSGKVEIEFVQVKREAAESYTKVIEAFEKENKKGVAYAHFTQVFPLPKSTKELLEKAKKIISIENNFTGQFADLIKKEIGINIENRVLRADGLPFTLEQIQKVIKEL